MCGERVRSERLRGKGECNVCGERVRSERLRGKGECNVCGERVRSEGLGESVRSEGLGERVSAMCVGKILETVYSTFLPWCCLPFVHVLFKLSCVYCCSWSFCVLL